MSKISDLIDRAMQYKMRGIALTDHGSMYGIKEFVDYVKKMRDKAKDNLKELQKEVANDALAEEKKAEFLSKIETAEKKLQDANGFKPIIGFEAYCAQRTLYDHDKDYKIYDERKQKERIVDMSGYHLLLLAKNITGYKNLCKLCSVAWVDGHYYHPRIDKNVLKQYSEGLVVCSACLGGEIPQLILNGKLEQAKEVVLWFKDVFGDDFYLEIQRHKSNRPEISNETYQSQEKVNKEILKIAAETNTKIVATNDIHFVDADHAEAHERLVCLSTGKKMSEAGRLNYTKEEYLKTAEQMKKIFEDIPEAISNTMEIFDKIEIYSLDSPLLMPKFPIPQDFGTEEQYRQKYTGEQLFAEFTLTADGKQMNEEEAEKKIEGMGGVDKLYRIKLEADYLTKLTYEGAMKRYNEITPEIRERLDFELNTMKLMGFPGYFLIVQDFVAAAKEVGVWVGPGRGSAAGSAVAYSLGITNINPLQYDLLFERFLNPDRISMPDIDIDFDDDGRAKILEWVTGKYGKESVAHIITFGVMQTKSSIADVGRVQEVPLSIVNEIKKMVGDEIPDGAIDEKTGKKFDKRPAFSVENCIKYNPDVKKRCAIDPQINNMMRYAAQLEGTVRQVGIHACGVIIGSDDLTNYVPIATAKEKERGKEPKDVLVTQYDGHYVESVGLIKMDFLGLKTLSILKEAVENIKKSKGITVNLDEIPPNDRATYNIYSSGQTTGIFQFESPGMKKYLRELQPSSIEDLIAMNALYRPGPMDYIPDFIARKQGRTQIKYDIPIMEKYLKETYGITVYQEQVMLLSRLLSNFTRGESDQLRKAMGKKISSMLAELKPKFINGGIANGYSEKILEKIWTDWEKFASYAFNKSHSASYSLLSYQTAYLKAHYPAEFMAANLSRNKDNNVEVEKFMKECKAMGIKVLLPDINESEMLFTVNKNGEIRFGLGGIKNVGNAAVESIINERNENGAYENLFDFLERTNLRACNKKTIESLVYSGAFDSFKIARENYFATESTIDDLIAYGKRCQASKESLENSLFGNDANMEIPHPKIEKAQQWNDLVRLNYERELIGTYVSAHPLDKYRSQIVYGCSHTLVELNNEVAILKTELDETAPSKETEFIQKNTKLFYVGGIITDVKMLTSAKGNSYSRFTVTDYSGQMEFSLFDGYNKKKPETQVYSKYTRLLEKDLFIIIKGYIKPSVQKDKLNPAISIKRINTDIIEVRKLEDVENLMLKNLKIELQLKKINKTLIDNISTLVAKNQGSIALNITVKDEENHSVLLKKVDSGINVSHDFLNELEEMAKDEAINFILGQKPFKVKKDEIEQEEDENEDEIKKKKEMDEGIND
jgi:DNA polymerase-3 subunit alpha